MMRSN